MDRLSLLVILCSSIPPQAQQSAAKSPWGSLNFLVGHWRGASQGEPGQGTGRRDYHFVLTGKFLQLKKIYPPQEKNPKGEVHEDLGFYSFDNKRKKLVFRQFHKESS